jgi:hypothetical protein
MKKLVALAIAAASGLLSTGAAVAGDVYWSVGISAPVVGAVVSNAPHRHHGPPVYYGPPAVVYHTAPVYVAPRPIYYAPAPVIVAPRHHHRQGWRHGHGHGSRHDHGRRHRHHHD